MSAGVEKAGHREVALILDRNFGSRLEAVALQMPVWIIESPLNDVVVQSLRSRGVGSITRLSRMPLEGAEEEILRALGDIEDHHGAYSSIPFEVLNIYGIERDAIPADALEEFMFRKVEERGGVLRLSKV